MTIAETREKCKSVMNRIPRDALLLAVLVLASTLSFGLGYLAGSDAARTGGISALEPPKMVSDVSTAGTGQVVASKNGTKYYLPGCSGADRISETNKIWFPSAGAAREAGYAPAANCPGL